MKVADFGLSRATKEGQDYYRMGQGGQLPIRWMSPESFLDHVFTSKSDVVRADKSFRQNHTVSLF